MDWIYLSPHLDDAVLSCGGRIYDQVQAGRRVEIWTICAGNAPAGELTPLAQELHARWQTGPEAQAVRRSEDKEACRRLGAGCRHFDLPDCIYRRFQDGSPVVTENDQLFQPLLPGENYLVEWLRDRLDLALPRRAMLVSPLTLGGHMDHHLTRQAAEALGRPLWYYPDYPYSVQKSDQLTGILSACRRKAHYPITGEGLHAWQDAVAAYSSQISTFWGGVDEMRRKIEQYWMDNRRKAVFYRCS